MITPWFMHCHRGHNTLVGVFAIPEGTFVRSYVDAWVDVAFYPSEPQPRELHRVFSGASRDNVENEIDNAIETFVARLRRPKNKPIIPDSPEEKALCESVQNAIATLETTSQASEEATVLRELWVAFQDREKPFIKTPC